eukprot:360465-Chlamydomonas_euryale.AAC.17
MNKIQLRVVVTRGRAASLPALDRCEGADATAWDVGMYFYSYILYMHVITGVCRRRNAVRAPGVLKRDCQQTRLSSHTGVVASIQERSAARSQRPKSAIRMCTGSQQQGNGVGAIRCLRRVAASGRSQHRGNWVWGSWKAVRPVEVTRFALAEALPQGGSYGVLGSTAVHPPPAARTPALTVALNDREACALAAKVCLMQSPIPRRRL